MQDAPVRVVHDGFARGHSLMVKQAYVGPTLTAPSFHPDEPAMDGDGFAHAPAKIALGVDYTTAVAVTIELLSFQFPATTPGQHGRL
jgi:hypothetical protein